MDHDISSVGKQPSILQPLLSFFVSNHWGDSIGGFILWRMIGFTVLSDGLNGYNRVCVIKLPILPFSYRKSGGDLLEGMFTLHKRLPSTFTWSLLKSFYFRF